MYAFRTAVWHTRPFIPESRGPSRTLGGASPLQPLQPPLKYATAAKQTYMFLFFVYTNVDSLRLDSYIIKNSNENVLNDNNEIIKI